MSSLENVRRVGEGDMMFGKSELTVGEDGRRQISAEPEDMLTRTSALVLEERTRSRSCMQHAQATYFEAKRELNMLTRSMRSRSLRIGTCHRSLRAQSRVERTISDYAHGVPRVLAGVYRESCQMCQCGGRSAHRQL